MAGPGRCFILLKERDKLGEVWADWDSVTCLPFLLVIFILFFLRVFILRYLKAYMPVIKIPAFPTIALEGP